MPKTMPAMTRRRFVRNVGVLAVGTALSGCFGEENDEPRTDELNGASVAVIGAGMAGLTAAYELHRRGATVTVLEARDRVGGRMNSATDLGFPTDLGASWIHGDEGDQPLVEIAEEAGVDGVPTDWEARCLIQDGVMLSDSAMQTVVSIENQLRARKEQISSDESVQRALDAVLQSAGLDADEEKMVRWVVRSAVAVEYATDLSSLSLWAWDEDASFDGDDVLIKQGTQRLAEEFLDDFEVRLGEAVTSVTWGDGATVTTTAGSHDADFVVVTLPLGVLQAGSVTFTPRLPASHRNAMQRLEMGTMAKVFLQYDDVFWDDDCAFFGETSTDWEFFDMQELTGRSVLMALTSGAKAEQWEREGRLVESAMDALQVLHPDAPTPSGTVASQWHTDPYARGSYSHVRVGGDLQDYGSLAASAGGVLFFAGEATSTDYPATMHGAHFSGVRAAQEIVGAWAKLAPAV